MNKNKIVKLSKSMRKVLLVLLCASLACGVKAQLRYGVKAGGTLSDFTLKSNGKTVDESKAGIGFNIGGMLEYSFTGALSLQPELLYVIHNIKDKDNIFSAKSKTQLQSIQLPVNLKYKMGVENLQFYVAAGPYLEYLVSAKSKTTSGSTKRTYNLFGDGSSLKHLNFGLGVGFGVEITKFTVGVGYQYGLVNLTKVKNSSQKLGAFNLSAGYFF
jgi:hypothetical protein